MSRLTCADAHSSLIVGAHDDFMASQLNPGMRPRNCDEVIMAARDVDTIVEDERDVQEPVDGSAEAPECAEYDALLPYLYLAMAGAF
jgi:hypothetical protein